MENFIEPWLLPYIPSTGDLMIDVGASQGEWCSLLSTRFKKILAYEPNPHAWQKFKNPPGNVEHRPEALSDHPGDALFYFYQSTKHGSLSFRDPDDQTGPLEKIKLVSLTTLDLIHMPAEHLDFIKIDTEGAEVEILRGGSKTLSQFHPYLIIECHSRQNVEKVFEILNCYGYELKTVYHPHYALESPSRTSHLWLIAKGGSSAFSD